MKRTTKLRLAALSLIGLAFVIVLTFIVSVSTPRTDISEPDPEFVAGEPGLSQNLRPVYRFWSDKNQTHFYTISETEKNDVIARYPKFVWKFEGVAFYAYETQVAGTSAVYRFWSDRRQTHFYTISSAERQAVINDYPDDVWKYERVAYYAFTGPQVGSNALYRFWSAQKQSHFYTADEAEKNTVVNKYPDHVWLLERTAYYVMTAPLPIRVRVKTVTYYGGHKAGKTFNYNALINSIKAQMELATSFRKYNATNAASTVVFEIVDRAVLQRPATQIGTNCNQYLSQVWAGAWPEAKWKQTNCWGSGTANYNKMIAENSVCEAANAGAIDEVWFLGFGNGGFWEANMTGPGAYFTNGPIVQNTSCGRPIHVMGFNYELPADYAMHSFGHRIEGTMRHFLPQEFAQFTVKSACGTVHLPPNGNKAYNYNNTANALSKCASWSPGKGTAVRVSCGTWGCSQLGYMRWWQQSLPAPSIVMNMTTLDGRAMPNWWRWVTNKY